MKFKVHDYIVFKDDKTMIYQIEDIFTDFLGEHCYRIESIDKKGFNRCVSADTLEKEAELY